ncbi:MAG: hypothetical protein RLZ12_200 [Bacillota bacterium]
MCSSATVQNSTAIGANAIAGDAQTTSLGYNAQCPNGSYSTALGCNSACRGFKSVALGYNTSTIGSNCIVAGAEISTSPGINNLTALGYTAVVPLLYNQ